MSYIYCNCGFCLEAPSTKEKIMSIKACPRCGEDLVMDETSFREALLEMLERIERLENSRLRKY